MTDERLEDDDFEFEDDILLDDELDSEGEEDIDAVLDEAFENEGLDGEWDEEDIDEFGEPTKSKNDKTRTLIYLLSGVAAVGIIGFHVLGQTGGSDPVLTPTETRETAGTIIETVPSDEDLVGFLVDPTELGEVDSSKNSASDAPPMPSTLMDDLAEVDEPQPEVAPEQLDTDILIPMPEPVQEPEPEIVSLDFVREPDLPAVDHSFPEPDILEQDSTQGQVPFTEDSLPAPASSRDIPPAMAQPMVAMDDTKYQALTSEIRELESVITVLKAEGQKEKEQDLKEIASLNSTIMKLEGKIERLSKEKAANAVKQNVSKPAKNEPKAPKVAVPQVAAAQPNAPKMAAPEAVAPKIRKKVISWELRSAQPGRAMVSQKGQQDIKTVEIGDFLSGVGRIRNISFVNGQWVVEGTVRNITR